MTILATADLHNRREWYDWLLKKSPQYDAVVIAGDLLDMFQDLPSQIEFLRQWVGKMKSTGTPLLICDGNHDFNSVPVPIPVPSPDSPSGWAGFVEHAHASEHWMDALVNEGASIVGGKVQVFPDLGGLIVSSLLDGRLQEEQNVMLMEEASSLRRSSRAPWMVLHHQPPAGLLGDEKLGSPLFGDWIEEYQPKIVFTGHDHCSPASNGTCSERIGISWVFNPGFRKTGPHPCCIDLDMTSMKYRWLR